MILGTRIHPYRYVRYFIFLVVLASSLCIPPFAAVAQEDGPPPFIIELPPVTRAFAIQNARIVQGPGRVIERGTVIVRNGLIEAVGANIPVPYDARIIKGDSLTVYAGFIDGYSNAGVPKPQKPKGPPPRVAKPGEPPNDVAGIQPERDVTTMLAPDDPSVDSLRMMGFTIAHTAPYGLVFPGTGAIILLGGDTPGEMVLRKGASLAATFQSPDDVYPATPMGIMARWRQLFLRAVQLQQQTAMHDKEPGGLERPEYDATLAAFFPVIDKKEPVAFRAEWSLEVRRAMRLSQERKFPLWIVGLKQGWDLPAELAKSTIPVFLSLDLPDAEKKGEKDSTSAPADSNMTAATDTAKTAAPPKGEPFAISEKRTLNPEDVESEKATLEQAQRGSRTQYYSTPAMLKKQGITFGFSSAGTAAGKIRKNLRTMIEHGLSEQDALAALTTNAAKLTGLEKITGTIDAGKLGNLVITNGPYFAEESTVEYVAVDGVLYDYTEAAKGDKKKREGKDSAKPRPRVAAETGGSLPEVPQAFMLQRPGARDGTLLIKNGTVLTVTNGTKEETDILVEKGKITQIGKGLVAPEDVPVIDASGQFVMPGIIDAHSHIAVSGPVNEWTNPITAEVAIEDVVDPYDVAIYRALAGGVTTSHLMHGSANAIGGQCETIKHRYGVTNPDSIAMQGAPRTIKFALGENPTRVHGRGFGVPPSTRMGVEMVFRRGFTEAKRYLEAKEQYEKEKGSNNRAVPPPYDLRLETLGAILKGDILVHCHSYRADEILMLMRVFKDFGIKRLVFQHVNEGFKVAPELAEFGAMASVFSDWWAYKFEVYYSTAYNAAILTKNGVVTSINSDSPELNRHLYLEAAKTMKYGGLSQEEALALITINPARQLGIETRVGSIEVGKEADLAIFSAHPLSIYAICQKTIVDGVVRFDSETDPDDMRLYVDPKTPIDAATVEHGHVDQCMEGVQNLYDVMYE